MTPKNTSTNICHPSIPGTIPHVYWVGLFLLTVGRFAYGKSVWSLLLTIEIRFGLFCLRWKIGLVFFAYGSPGPEIGSGLLCLQFPHCK